ncbi:manganese efflux pump [Cetobacterium sp. 8H]|uniref:manganese efflux pump MntP n=1 Tax=Cetobacterium sp. 8H TaxID=2759681 RepID=UPI00163D29F1|nr:manganese efflux pump MntP family protein [Cetobacterium sp. 8H]MBC2850464.1 manganese efflux pump [Cetobacterium sp. 8H]
MDTISLILISVGLAMDAFAVSLTEGLAIKKLRKRNILKIALVFGGFQAIMPYIGWRVGEVFADKISRYDYIITTVLLLLIGGKMIYDGWKEEECEVEGKCDMNSNLFILGFATSIDALAIGFSFSLIPNIDIYYSIEIIGLITFLIASIGVYLGHKMGHLISYKTEYLGGGILVLMGLKSLVGHFI